MPFGFIGRVSDARQLKDSLDVSTQRVRAIAQRVAAASVPGAKPFSVDNASGIAETPTTNLEAEMTSLADEQLRYDAAAKLLEKTYLRIRSSLRER
jgi:flagellar basal body rod protein FlgB